MHDTSRFRMGEEDGWETKAEKTQDLNEWQDRDYVLRWFGKEERPARRAYRRYVKEGIEQGKRPDLVGGGLVHSIGGWSQVASMRRLGHKELSDGRILGSGDFVNEVINEANKVLRYQFTGRALSEKIDQYIKELCQKEGVNIWGGHGRSSLITR